MKWKDLQLSIPHFRSWKKEASSGCTQDWSSGEGHGQKTIGKPMHHTQGCRQACLFHISGLGRKKRLQGARRLGALVKGVGRKPQENLCSIRRGAGRLGGLVKGVGRIVE